MRTRNWILIRSGFGTGRTNMRTDRDMLEDFVSGAIPPTFRLYGWKPASFSLGKSQEAKDVLDLERCRAEGVDFVERITGGGVLLHDADVTYSLVCSKEDLGLDGPVKESYGRACSFLLAAFRALGLEPRFAHEDGSDAALGRPSAVCLAGREEYDILVGGKKLGGNAQRRKRDIIFQHGSIPLELNRKRMSSMLKGPDRLEAASCTSLEELLGRPVSFEEMETALEKSFRKTFNVEWIDDI